MEKIRKFIDKIEEALKGHLIAVLIVIVIAAGILVTAPYWIPVVVGPALLIILVIILYYDPDKKRRESMAAQRRVDEATYNLLEIIYLALHEIADLYPSLHMPNSTEELASNARRDNIRNLLIVRLRKKSDFTPEDLTTLKFDLQEQFNQLYPPLVVARVRQDGRNIYLDLGIINNTEDRQRFHQWEYNRENEMASAEPIDEDF